MNDGDIVVACQSFKNWFDNGIRDLNVGLNYKIIRKSSRKGILVSEDSLPIIYEINDLPEAVFNFTVERILTCQRNNVVINTDSFIAICDTVDLPSEEFEFVSRRMQICQLNNVSCDLAIKSCKKTSK